MKRIVFRILEGALVVAALLFLRGERPPLAAASSGQPHPSGYANPAALYCGGLGYTYQLQQTDEGEVGVCKFPDATACDAWQFLQGSCGGRYSICEQQGLRTELRRDGDSPYSRDYAVCVDASGAPVGSVIAMANLPERATKTGCSEAPPLAIEEDPLPPDLSAVTLPPSFDWRAQPKGSYLTGVRDQGQCGSCWAFASVGVAEAALNIANNRVGNSYNLSEQYLVSGCSGAGNCCGGYPSGALYYIRTSGIPDEACMSYVDGDYYTGCSCYSGACDPNCRNRTGGQCSDKACSNRCSNYATRLVKFNSFGLAPTNPDSIKALLVSKGPLSASIWMEGEFDANGVYMCSSAPTTDHVIVLVGYDDAGGYWIARNSWGATWNGDGYFKIGYGQCLVEDWVFYATSPRTEPVTKQPLAETTDRTPTYKWSKLGAATQYQVQLKKGTTSIYTKTISSAAACQATPCSLTPTTNLAYGAYRWRVRAYMWGGWKGWSPAQAFSVVSPLVPVPQAPSGAIAAYSPTYKWIKVLDATDYEYTLLSGTTPIYTRTVTAAACGVATCSDTPPDVLAPGSYQWRVRAMLGGVWQAYSPYKTFSTPAAP